MPWVGGGGPSERRACGGPEFCQGLPRPCQEPLPGPSQRRCLATPDPMKRRARRAPQGEAPSRLRSGGVRCTRWRPLCRPSAPWGPGPLAPATPRALRSSDLGGGLLGAFSLSTSIEGLARGAGNASVFGATSPEFGRRLPNFSRTSTATLAEVRACFGRCRPRLAKSWSTSSEVLTEVGRIHWYPAQRVPNSAKVGPNFDIVWADFAENRRLPPKRPRIQPKRGRHGPSAATKRANCGGSHSRSGRCQHDKGGRDE